MLKKLSVKNYVLIDHLEIDFSGRINIITGETGAGKSILLGALSLILGQRADSKTLFDQKLKCIIEGTFDISRHHLKKLFSDFDIDYEDVTTIRRELTPSGKSRSFINDTPVNLNVLKQLGSQLVNVHSQHETISLNNRQFQLRMVDTMTQHDDLLRDFKDLYLQYIHLNKELSSVLSQNKGITDLDYLRFQYNELSEAALQEGEQSTLEENLRALENSVEIRENLTNVIALITNNESSALNILQQASSSLRNTAKFNKKLSDLSERLESLILELQDINQEIETSDNIGQTDPEELNSVNERLDTIYRLQQKHRLETADQLITLRDQLEVQLSNIEGLTEIISALKEEIEKTKSELIRLGASLRINRTKKTSEIERLVTANLKKVGMPNAQFKIQIEELPFEKLTASGLDKVTFLFSANKGGNLDDLQHVASGGELSRLMLVLKSMIASNSNLPTLIFDEIDAGISGEVAFKVGDLLDNLGQEHQTILITHLPQIARLGEDHFYVYKETIRDRTFTRMKHLDKKERVEELAKMIGGENFSEVSKENAIELLHY